MFQVQGLVVGGYGLGLSLYDTVSMHLSSINAVTFFDLVVACITSFSFLFMVQAMTREV